MPQMPCCPAVVSCTFTLAQAATASHLKVTPSIRLLGRLRGKREEGRGCKSKKVGEELEEWKSASLSSAARLLSTPSDSHTAKS